MLVSVGLWKYTHTHTTILLLVWNMSGSTRVSRYQKGKTKKVKTNLDLLEIVFDKELSLCASHDWWVQVLQMVVVNCM